MQILVFDDKGALNAYVDADAKTSDITISTIYGDKTIWAVVNEPDVSQITTLANLKKVAVDLGSHNSTTESKGFVMAGSATCTLDGSSVSASISVKRIAARIALQKINNSLPASYGSITIENAVLTNVAGNQQLDCSASISTWYNRMGRKDNGTKDQIINSSSLASHPTLTFKDISTSVANGQSLSPETPYLFYTFQNPTSYDATGWSSTFSVRKTRLVVTATVGTTKYYYPITIDTPARNTAYCVELTIAGLGSTDPDIPVEKGIITATVTVDPWQQGEVYNATI